MTSGDASEAHDLHPSAKRVADWAMERGVSLTIQEYPEDGARTAEDAAAAVGSKVDQIVKSMIFAVTTLSENEGGATDGAESEHELVLALTAGSHLVDTDALAEIAGVSRCGRAKPEAVRTATGYAIGGVPPFAHANELRTWIDPHLLTFDEVWAAAGTPRHVFPISPATLANLTGAVEASFTVTPD
jgi:prolyl-tRNA editing enzyme YbaK/EbsC (Cys-tRNA(Pro) deacylase)